MTHPSNVAALAALVASSALGAATLMTACSGTANVPTDGTPAVLDAAPTDPIGEPSPADAAPPIGKDAGAPDARIKDASTADATTVDAAPQPYNYGKTPIDEACGGNFGASDAFPSIQASPSGDKLVFTRCDAARSVVVRDLNSAAVTVLATGNSSYAASPTGLLYVNGSATEQREWSMAAPLRLPVAVDITDFWRIRQTATSLQYAEKVPSTTNPLSREKLAFYSASGAQPVYSAEYDVQRASRATAIFNRDGSRVAALERYPSELKSRLRVAAPTANAAVSTYALNLFEPQWVTGGQVGSGALVLSGSIGAQRASELYFIDFATGAVTTVSTADVIPRKPPALDDVPAIAIAGNIVYFMTGDSGSGNVTNKRATVYKWDATTPARAATVVATLSDVLIYDLARAQRQRRSLILSPDGSHLLLSLVNQSGNVWAAVPVGGGTAARIVAKTGNIEIGLPNHIGTSNYQESDTKFVDIQTGATSIMTGGTPFISRDGSAFFTSSASGLQNGVWTYRVQRKIGTAPESLFFSTFSPSGSTVLLPVRNNAMVVRLLRAPIVNNVAQPFDLYLFE
jgi:hypothetical protein